MRVLVGEDETLIRLDLKAMLERAGFDVCAEARDGLEALELARSEEPDLAVLDVKMPRLDGIEAARRMLDERPIPIVIVSAFTERSLVSRAADAGVFGYLAKPFRENDLLPAIATAQARFGELAAVRDQVESLADVSPYFPHEVRYHAEIEPTFERYVYGPLLRTVLRMANGLKGLQAGSLHAYLAYVIALVVWLVLLVWWRG